LGMLHRARRRHPQYHLAQVQVTSNPNLTFAPATIITLTPYLIKPSLITP
jgi:hypothetical protein